MIAGSHGAARRSTGRTAPRMGRVLSRLRGCGPGSGAGPSRRSPPRANRVSRLCCSARIACSVNSILRRGGTRPRNGISMLPSRSPMPATRRTSGRSPSSPLRNCGPRLESKRAPGRCSTRCEALCEPLGAAPALLRAKALAGRLAVPTVADAPVARTVGLSAREVEVLILLAAGRTNREIAAALFVSVHTVNAHVKSILGKTGSANRVEAAAFAHTHGLT